MTTRTASRKRRLIAVGLLLFTGFVIMARTWQQKPSTEQKDLSALFPPHPLIYLDSSDFLSQLERWDHSRVKAQWLSSANFKQFQNSRLYLRLGDKLQEFEALLDLSIDLPLVKSLTGGRAALGLYSISDLEFLFVTAVPSEGFEQGTFFSRRAKFEQKSAEGAIYFTRSGHGHNVSFLVSQGLFLLATDENLLRTALHNLADLQSRSRLSNDKRFQQNRAALPANADLWMFLDMEALGQSRYFRNEWLHRNVGDFSDLQTGVVQLRLEREMFTERRKFWLKEGATGEKLSSGVRTAINPDLLRILPVGEEFVRAEAASPAEISRLIYHTVLNPLRQMDQTLSLTWTESPYDVSPLLKTNSLYFQNIDEAMTSHESPEQLREKQRAEMLKRLEDIIVTTGSNAFIQCGAHQVDTRGYIQVQQAILMTVQREPFLKFKSELQDQFNRLYHLGRPAVWQKLDDEWETLGTLPSLALGFHDQVLCLGNSTEFARRILQKTPRPVEASARMVSSYGRLDVEKFRSGFESLFGFLDYQGKIRNPRGAPAYFSQNLGSLLAALSPIKSVTAESWLQDGTLDEEVKYAIGSRGE